MYTRWARFRLLGCACALIGCASGYVDNPALAAASTSSGGKTTGIGGSGPAGKGSAGSGAKTGAAGAGATASSTAKTGDPCKPGAAPTCTCDSTHTMGVRMCQAAAGATMGTLSACQSCAMPMPDAGGGDVQLRDAGSGRGGTGGSGGNGGTGGRTGGGGSGGTRAPTMMQPGKACASPCTNTCFPVGILPCCNALGTCGCTWAPGAYCL